MVKNKAGDRKVVLGPATTILEYDEELEVLALSKGKPKSDKELLKTVYLQVENNKVSDIIEVETSDFTKAAITVSFRGNFIGDSSKWFNVSNYTKLLSEHMRSKIRRAVMQHDVESFYRNAADIIRDTVLGVVTEGKRLGFTFTENNMHIYDVEVLEVRLLDSKIQQLLSEVQREGIDHAIQRARLKREVEQTALVEDAKRKKIAILSESEKLKFDLQKKSAAQESEMRDIEFLANQALSKNRNTLTTLEIEIRQAELQRDTLARQLDLEFAGKEQDLRVGYLQAEAAALAQKAAAVSPHLIKALQAFGDRTTLERLSLAISPFGMIDLMRGQSVVGTFQRLLKGSSLENLLVPRADD
jgi:major vault protein